MISKKKQEIEGIEKKLGDETTRALELQRELDRIKAESIRSEEKLVHSTQQKGFSLSSFKSPSGNEFLTPFEHNVDALLEDIEKAKDDLLKREQKLKRTLQKNSEPIEGFGLLVSFMQTRPRPL